MIGQDIDKAVEKYCHLGCERCHRGASLIGSLHQDLHAACRAAERSAGKRSGQPSDKTVGDIQDAKARLKRHRDEMLLHLETEHGEVTV